LDSSNKERIARRARESKAALDLDMRIVQEFMKQDSVEKESKNRKKDELRTEMLEYKTYLEQMRAYERMRDGELNTMYRNEEDRIWNEKDAKWQKEQAARNKLMKEVLDGRKEQLRFAGIAH
jgi:trichoplein keratin filament-binding protein